MSFHQSKVDAQGRNYFGYCPDTSTFIHNNSIKQSFFFKTSHPSKNYTESIYNQRVFNTGNFTFFYGMSFVSQTFYPLIKSISFLIPTKLKEDLLRIPQFFGKVLRIPQFFLNFWVFWGKNCGIRNFLKNPLRIPQFFNREYTFFSQKMTSFFPKNQILFIFLKIFTAVFTKTFKFLIRQIQ